MSFYANQLADLRYACGNISFRLVNSDQRESAVSVTLPFHALESISEFLSAEVLAISPVHSNWLKFESGRFEGLTDAPKEDPFPLGPLLATV